MKGVCITYRDGNDCLRYEHISADDFALYIAHHAIMGQDTLKALCEMMVADRIYIPLREIMVEYINAEEIE